MKQKTYTILKILTFTTLSLFGLMVIAFLLLNTQPVQQRLAKYATELLSNRLQTHVEIESTDISFFGGNINLYGVTIEDQQQRKMLHMDRLSANLKIWELLNDRVIIEETGINGMSAMLIPRTDSTDANYQFLIDAFKKKPTNQVGVDSVAKKKKRLSLDISRVKLEDIHLHYGFNDFHLLKAVSSKKNNGQHFITINQLNVKTDNHKPRKNTGKPKRGFFDAGHLDITTDMRLTLDPTDKDSLRIELTECTALDSITGIDLRDVRAKGVLSKGQLYLHDIVVQQKYTTLNISNGYVQLPNKKKGIHMNFSTGKIKGRAILQDISRAFAPFALKKFTIPLDLSLTMSGTDSTIYFNNVRVNTIDKALTIAAKGDITHLREKKLVDVHFIVNSMHAKPGIVEKIINQFTVKKLMMKELQKLGNITYTGDFHIIHKKEAFQGVLNTSAGRLHFNFALDENTKYINGQVSSKALALGHVFELKDLGNIDASARFSVDFSGPRTKAIRKNKGGKLPIGTVHATVNDCSYKNVHVKNLTADIKSDGAEALGNIRKTGGLLGQIDVSFSWIDTKEKRKLKITHTGIHPRLPWEKDKDGKDKHEPKKKKDDKKKDKKKKKFLIF